jgi:glutathione synthase/RimK-type ligase-like ATP-grasp enzyme
MGLAPFLRMSIAGTDLTPIGKDLLARAENPDDTVAMMDLSTYMLCIGQHDLGLTIQQQALQLQHTYSIPAKHQPAKLRLLALMAAGDLSCNMPVDCLLENSDVDLALFYVSPHSLQNAVLPEHDVLLVAIGESDSNQILLSLLEPLLANWPRPVLNPPAAIPLVARDTASKLLQGIPGLLIPPTLRVTRSSLTPIANASRPAAYLLGEHDFPLIIRPVGSHAGNDLQKIDHAQGLTDYLANCKADDFFVSAFINYSSSDGLFRKYRIALVDGVPFACHMAVSSHWMVHYVNAGMYLDAAKRAEEAHFMEHFAAFAQRHAAALGAIHQRSQLEYVCLDCAETQDGQLFIFEIDHAMVVHALDTIDLFPYKQVHMQKVLDAFRKLLFQKAGHNLPHDDQI